MRDAGTPEPMSTPLRGEDGGGFDIGGSKQSLQGELNKKLYPPATEVRS